MAKYTGVGGKFSVDMGVTPGTFTEVAQVQSIGSVAVTADETEVTTLDNTSGFRDFLATFKDAGELPVTLVWDPVLPSHSELWDLFVSGETKPMKIEFPIKPTAYEASFNGFIKAFPTPQVTPDDALMSEVSIRVVGTVSIAAKAAAVAATEPVPAVR